MYLNMFCVVHDDEHGVLCATHVYLDMCWVSHDHVNVLCATHDHLNMLWRTMIRCCIQTDNTIRGIVHKQKNVSWSSGTDDDSMLHMGHTYMY